MANPTDISEETDRAPVIVEAVTTAAAISLCPNMEYFLQHNGFAVGGGAATGRIQCSTGTSTAADTAGEGQFTLVTGNIVGIGPGIGTLNFKAPAGSPTMSIFPGKNDFGAH